MWRSKLPSLVAQRMENERRRITQREIADRTDLRLATISVWMRWGEFKRLDAVVVSKLMKYFDCQESDLYEWIAEDDDLGKRTANAMVRA